MFPRGWQPKFIASLVLDLNADLIAGNDGDAIGTWVNAAPNGSAGNFTQATGAQQPLLKRNILNGRSVVRFDGSNDCMSSSLAVPGGASAPITFYWVFKRITPATGTTLGVIANSGGKGNYTSLLNFSGYSNYLSVAALAAGSNVGLTDSPDTNFHIWSWTWDGTSNTSTSAYKIYLDNISKTVSSAAGSLGAIGSSLIGAETGGGGSAINMDLARVLVYAGNHTAQQMTAVNRYLHNLYGI
jgi:hypothetical protein